MTLQKEGNQSVKQKSESKVQNSKTFQQKEDRKKLRNIQDTIRGILDANWRIKSWNMSFVDKKMIVEFEHD